MSSLPRNVIKQDLRRIAEIGIIAVLGKVPRKLRRGAGRSFACEAYRKLNNLPILNHKVNPAVVDWIVKEYVGYQAELSKAGSETNRRTPEADGPAALPLADQRNDGQGDEEALDDHAVSRMVGGE